MKAPNYETVFMASKRGVGCEGGPLLLLPDTKTTTALVERFMFWHVSWKRFKAMGWIIDTNAHGDYDFIVIPPFKPECNSMKENIDFYSDEKMLIDALADDYRFKTKRKYVSLRKEYDEFVVQFKVLRDLVIQHQKGNVLATHSFPRGILVSNRCMLDHLKDLVVQQATKNTINGIIDEEEKIRVEAMARRRLALEHDLRMKVQRENMQQLMAENELMKVELQRRAEDANKRLLEEEIRATLQADSILANGLLLKKTELALEQTPMPQTLQQPQLPTSSFLPNKPDHQSIIGDVEKAFREVQMPTRTNNAREALLRAASQYGTPQVPSGANPIMNGKITRNDLEEAYLDLIRHKHSLQKLGTLQNMQGLEIAKQMNGLPLPENNSNNFKITPSEMVGARRGLTTNSYDGVAHPLLPLTKRARLY